MCKSGKLRANVEEIKDIVVGRTGVAPKVEAEMKCELMQRLEVR